MRLTRWTRRWLWAVGAVGTALALLLGLTYYGVLRPTRWIAERYPVHGVDVSSYQGDIDWPTLAAQDIAFAFIKATEGSSLTDRCFAYNFEQARLAGLRVGAYHFFSFDSPGETQAAHFIATVPKTAGMLPPVIDVEYYGDYFADPPTADRVTPQLQTLIDRLTAHYGTPPILYATGRAYTRYLKGNYPECAIWIRDVYTPAALPDGRDWAFWQYDDHAVLMGYDGDERYIDMNVFRGTREEFERYGV